MLKSILIGLDGSQDGEAALGLGLRWAKQYDALAAGLAVVDEPGILVSDAGGLTEVNHQRATELLLADARRHADEVLRDFGGRCDEAGVRHCVLEDAGAPYVQILTEAQRFDLVLLGLRTHFDFGWQDQPDDTPGRVLRDSPRPVVVVPKDPAGREAVVVAYDGSLQSARALAAFEASGLAHSREVHVVAVVEDRQAAGRHVERAAEFLRSHGVEARPHRVESVRPPAEVILERAEHLGAGLLVMGAYGQPVLREFFLGSVTRQVLKHATIPVFCFH
jgi:nucleotide-binding universal stress UspA family protein